MQKQLFMLFQKTPQPQTRTVSAKDLPGAYNYRLLKNKATLEEVKQEAIRRVGQGAKPRGLVIAREYPGQITIEVKLEDEQSEKEPDKKQEKVNKALEAILEQAEKQQKQNQKNKRTRPRAEGQLRRAANKKHHEKKAKEATERAENLERIMYPDRFDARHQKGGTINED